MRNPTHLLSSFAAFGALVSGLLASACQPGGPDEPPSAIVSAEIVAADGVNPTGPLRLAALWLTRKGEQSQWITTLDEPVAKVNAVQAIRLPLPPKSVRGTLVERSTADMSCGEYAGYFEASVVMPWFVVYEDLDQSGNFNPNLPESAGADRVWATTQPSDNSIVLVAFEDLDQALSQEPTEVAECVRNQTNNEYTAFFMALNYSSYVIPVNEPLVANIELSPTDYPSVVLGCDASVSPSSSSYTKKTYLSQTATVDSRVAGDNCSNSPYTCSVADVASTLPSSFETIEYPGYMRWFTCSVAGSLDVLWMTEASVLCTGCTCKWTQSDAAWVVDSVAMPSGWPCGTTLEYCGTPQPTVWSRPTYCAGISMERPL